MNNKQLMKIVKKIQSKDHHLVYEKWHSFSDSVLGICDKGFKTKEVEGDCARCRISYFEENLTSIFIVGDPLEFKATVVGTIKLDNDFKETGYTDKFTVFKQGKNYAVLKNIWLEDIGVKR